MASATDGWIVGTCWVAKSDLWETFLLRYHNGAWSVYQG